MIDANKRQGDIAGLEERNLQEYKHWRKSFKPYFKEIAIFNDLDKIAKNAIWVSASTFDELYTNQEGACHPYIQIANRVYNAIKSESLDNNFIAMTPELYHYCESAKILFGSKSKHLVSIAPYYPIDNQAFTIGEIEFLFQRRKNFSNTYNEHVAYELNLLHQVCLKALKNTFASLEQTFFIKHPKGDLSLTVKNIKKLSDDNLSSAFGLITKSTFMRFNSPNCPNISLVAHFVKEEKAKFIFEVESKENDLLPLIIDYEEFSKQVKIALKDKELITGVSYFIKFAEKTFKLCLANVISNEKPAVYDNYKVSYEFKNNPIRFISNTIVFSSKTAFSAKTCEMALIDLKKKRESFNSVTITSSELESKLREKVKNFVVGQHFMVDLPFAEIKVLVKKAWHESNLLSKTSKKSTPLWELRPETEITFIKQIPFNWPFVDGQNTVNATDITLSIKLEPGAILAVDEAIFIAFAKEALTKGAALEQQFELNLCGKKISCYVIGLAYALKNKSQLKYGALAMLDKETNIKLINESILNLAIIKKVLSKDPLLYLREQGFGGLSARGRKAIFQIVNERAMPLKGLMEKSGFDRPITSLLLYGPSGTGKSLLADRLKNLLSCGPMHLKHLSVVDIPSDVNKAELFVKEIFDQARLAGAKFQKASELFIVIIDQLQMLAPKYHKNERHWHQGILNALWEQLSTIKSTFHNVLFIGLCQDIESLKHIGGNRFDKQIDLSILDDEGRMEIFKIHSASFKNVLVNDSLDYLDLVNKAKDMMGKDIKEIVNLAADYAAKRMHQKVLKGQAFDLIPHDQTLMMQDFDKAFKKFYARMPSDQNLSYYL